MPFHAQRVQPVIPRNKFLKVMPVLLNLLHMGSLHFAVILWSEFFSHRLAQITLQSGIAHEHCQALARRLFEPGTARKPAQELRCSEDSIFFSDFGKLVSVNSTSATGSGSKAPLAPACSQASDLKEMRVLTDHGTRGYINV